MESLDPVPEPQLVLLLPLLPLSQGHRFLFLFSRNPFFRNKMLVSAALFSAFKQPLDSFNASMGTLSAVRSGGACAPCSSNSNSVEALAVRKL